MEFFDIFVFAILVIVIIILRKFNAYTIDSTTSFQKLESRIDRLQKLIEDLKVSGVRTEEKVGEEFKPVFSAPEEIIPVKEIIEPLPDTVPEPLITIPEPSPVILFENEKISERAEVEEPEIASVAAFSQHENPVEVRKKIRQVQPPKKSWSQKFKEENPDIEKFIGENLINKIGILILVLGISFFVKYAIDKDWINEPARVGIGILAGALVLGIAHKLKANYKAFSSVFVAGAFAIFYFTIAIAFQEYHLFSQTVAFAIMVVITIFSSLISVSYDRQELGVLSLIAGFAVPFMVSTGDGNYLVLFSYIAILNIGMLFISYFKKWNTVNILSFLFTCILFIGWWFNAQGKPVVPHLGAFIFAALFYVIFSIAAVLNNLRSAGTFSKIQYGLIVANTFFFFGMGMSIIDDWGIGAKGLFTVAIGIYNLIFASVLYRRFGLNKNAVYLLLGLTLTFATMTIPIQFKGNFITLFWACEAVLLFWLAQKSKIQVFKWGGVIVQALMLVSLMMDWEKSYSNYIDSNEIIHSVFLTGIVAVVSLLYTYFLLRNDKDVKTYYGFAFNPVSYSKIAIYACVIVAYFVGIFEVMYQANQYNESNSKIISFGAAYHFVFSAALIYYLLKKDSLNLKRGAVILGIVNLILFMMAFVNLPIEDLSKGAAYSQKNFSAYLLHYVLWTSLIFTLFLIIKNTLKQPVLEILQSRSILWIFAVIGVIILSQELIVQVVFFNSQNVIPDSIASISKMKINSEAYYALDDRYEAGISNLKRQIVKVGFPILWGIISFLLLIIGIKKDWKQLRIIALVLLGITVIKLFVYDISDASETGKIIAFILLGVLILIISFVYQKLKKLVTDEPKNTEENENI